MSLDLVPVEKKKAPTRHGRLRLYTTEDLQTFALHYLFVRDRHKPRFLSMATSPRISNCENEAIVPSCCFSAFLRMAITIGWHF